MNMISEFEEQGHENLKGIRLGLLEAAVNVRDASKEVDQMIASLEEDIMREYPMDAISRIPAIAEARLAYKRAGNDPNRYRPSADSLIRRIVKKQGLYRISNVVDVLNIVSIRSGFSIGGYDTAQIRGRITAGIGRGGEPYEGIGRGMLNITNLPVLRDEAGAFGSPTSDSVRTMIQLSTQRILMVFFDFGQNEALPGAMRNMQQLLELYADAGEIAISMITLN